MSLSFVEIKQRAIEFSYKWANTTSELSDAKSFWDDFFNVFGLSRKRIATFEYAVEKSNHKLGYIDLFWKGTLVVEHKSRGKNLTKAYSQALEYFQGLPEEDLPKYVIVSDFELFRIYDLESDSSYSQFHLNELYKNIHLFHFITGYKKIPLKQEEHINIEAGELIGQLYKALCNINSPKNDLSIMLVRILFCLFADHTGIWQKNHFQYYILQNTKLDGSDLGLHLNLIFDILNTKDSERIPSLNEDLNIFTYINGGLFKERLPTTFFNEITRNILLDCCKFNWGEISPVIFGSIFQSAMSPEKRDELGVYYTSETDILKLLNPLMLDELNQNFKSYMYNKKKLEDLLNEINNIQILDPACGCGNFLILSYRELRLLQASILKQISILNGKYINEPHLQLRYTLDSVILDVDSMHGFEIDMLAAMIAKVALWLVDHQLNTNISLEFSEDCIRIPLKKSAHIVNKNSLEINWNDYVDTNKLTYIVGNPPYIPSNNRNERQKHDMELTFKGLIYKNYGKLDYVCAWYAKAANLIKNTSIKVAFISTNSITQGEQVQYLWEPLMNKGIVINFAHRTFMWKNGLSNDASIFVVIIGFSFLNNSPKLLYDYETPISEPHLIQCKNINPYLLNKPSIIIKSANKPLSLDTPLAKKGSMPNDHGHLILSNKEKIQLCKSYPGIDEFIKPYISSKSMLNNEKRWCIWLKDSKIEDWKHYSFIVSRVSKVREYRQNLYNQKNKSNIKKAMEYPYLFENTKQPATDYICIPRHSSSNRKYIPIKFCDKNEIISDSCIAVHSNDKYILGILMSSMHMAWVKEYCGRIKNDFRYSITLCYNTFAFITPTPSQKEHIINLVNNILSIRDSYKNVCLADLYNPLYNHKNLIDAHNKLDNAVQKLYSKRKLDTDSSKIDVLINSYFELIN